MKMKAISLEELETLRKEWVDVAKSDGSYDKLKTFAKEVGQQTWVQIRIYKWENQEYSLQWNDANKVEGVDIEESLWIRKKDKYICKLGDRWGDELYVVDECNKFLELIDIYTEDHKIRKAKENEEYNLKRRAKLIQLLWLEDRLDEEIPIYHE